MPRRGGALPRLRGERGSVAASLVLLPTVILAVLLVIHFALAWHGRNVVAAAAQDGLAAVQLDGAAEGSGRAAAERTLNLFDGFDSTRVAVDLTPDTATVAVTGDVRGLFEGLWDEFTITVTGPVERFYPEDERNSGPRNLSR